MPASVVFDTSASREYLKALRWYAARAGEQIAAAFADEVRQRNGASHRFLFRRRGQEKPAASALPLMEIG